MNIVVTGGAGFIGSNLVSVLLDKGFDVTVLDNIKYWDNALVWDPDSISKATKDWFKYLE